MADDDFGALYGVEEEQLAAGLYDAQPQAAQPGPKAQVGEEDDLYQQLYGVSEEPQGQAAAVGAAAGGWAASRSSAQGLRRKRARGRHHLPGPSARTPPTRRRLVALNRV